MISFVMRAVLFMAPSMNRADSVALMQIALTHSSLAYLSCLFSASTAEKDLVNVTKGGKNVQTSHPTVP